MKRYHLELERTKRAHQLHLRSVHSQGNPIDCVCEFQAGRFRKQKPLGCRRTRCLLCHFEKIFGIPKVSDRVRNQRFVVSLEDYLPESNRESFVRRSPTKPCS
jgi:hypothetical protein